MLYYLLIILTFVVSVVWGFRRGLARQTPRLIGIAFGIICAHIFSLPATEAFDGLFDSFHGKVQEGFLYSVAARSFLFLAVTFLFSGITSFLGRVLSGGDRTILDNIGGAIFSVFETLMYLSIFLNLLLGLTLNEKLLHDAVSDDGNIVEGVLLISPAVLGGPDAQDLGHAIQLEDAKKIS